MIGTGSFETPRIFKEIQNCGGISEEEMFCVFNMGVGMILVVDPAGETAIRSHIESCAIPTYALGTVVGGERGVVFV